MAASTSSPSPYRNYSWKIKCFSRGAMTLSVILSLSMPTTGLVMGNYIFVHNISFILFAMYVFYELFNILGNWYLFLQQYSALDKFYVEASAEDLKDTRPVGEGSTRTHYACHLCNCIIFKGMHHCGLCGRCIPLRDHHCFFLSSCVGQHNIRYFCAFCLHVGISCLVFVLIGLLYGRIEYKDLFSKDFLYYFVPYALAKLVTHEISFWHFSLVTLIYLAFSTGAVALIYSLTILFKVVIANSFPSSLPKDYLSENVIPAFGPGWKMGLVVPMPFNFKYLDHLRLTKLV